MGAKATGSTAKTAKTAKEPRSRSARDVAARLCQPPAVGQRTLADRDRGSLAARPASTLGVQSARLCVLSAPWRSLVPALRALRVFAFDRSVFACFARLCVRSVRLCVLCASLRSIGPALRALRSLRSIGPAWRSLRVFGWARSGFPVLARLGGPS